MTIAVDTNILLDILIPNAAHAQSSLNCLSCEEDIPYRQHILADFLIGAHAKAQADRLITRDRSFYRTYFRGLNIVTS